MTRKISPIHRITFSLIIIIRLPPETALTCITSQSVVPLKTCKISLILVNLVPRASDSVSALVALAVDYSVKSKLKRTKSALGTSCIPVEGTALLQEVHF